jgi:CMP-N-acetylneuraminic acid synthetase
MKPGADPRVTVYIVCYNYARFLADAIESVRSQSFPDWELIILNDGSTDDTQEVLNRFRDDPRIRILANGDHHGLRASANRCIRESRGGYVLRLDADDLLHPYCLDAYWRETTRAPDVSVFFSDYYYIDEAGNVQGVEASWQDQRAITFPPHGSGSFVRRDTFDAIGYYDDSLDADLPGAAGHGQELWLKVLHAGLEARHVPLPLFMYRQHGPTVSSDPGRLIRAQGLLKHRLAEKLAKGEKIVAVIPMRDGHLDVPNLPFMKYSGRTLLEGAVEAARDTQSVSEVLVTTDSPDVAKFMASQFPEVTTHLRPQSLRQPTTSIREVLQDLAERAGFGDDVILCLTSVETPRRTGFHIQKAIDNFLLFDVDSVVAVYEERSPIYQRGPHGLRSVNPAFEYHIRREREAVYVDPGVVRVFRVRNLRNSNFLGTRIGHSLMARDDAVNIRSSADFHLIDQVPERSS